MAKILTWKGFKCFFTHQRFHRFMVAENEEEKIFLGGVNERRICLVCMFKSMPESEQHQARMALNIEMRKRNNRDG